MKDLDARLRALGHSPAEYILQDDGAGQYIKRWLSNAPRPQQSAIENVAGAELRAAQEQRLAYITLARNAAMASLTVEVEGATYDADEASTYRMTGALQMWRLALETRNPLAPASIVWLGADNVARTLSINGLAAVANAAWLAQQAVWARNSAAKTAVMAATTVGEVASVEF